VDNDFFNSIDPFTPFAAQQHVAAISVKIMGSVD
jgi:hypothetical protein